MPEEKHNCHICTAGLWLWCHTFKTFTMNLASNTKSIQMHVFWVLFNNKHANMEGEVFMDSHPYTKNNRQLMAAGDGEWALPLKEPLIGCPVPSGQLCNHIHTTNKNELSNMSLYTCQVILRNSAHFHVLWDGVSRLSGQQTTRLSWLCLSISGIGSTRQHARLFTWVLEQELWFLCL